MNPETSEIKNGELETVRPDILEEKLRNVKEMVNYLTYFWEQEAKN